jgi:uncharacterized cupredoxin-like copper-binding protein
MPARRSLALAAVIASAALLSACGAESQSSAGTTITVTMTDKEIALSESSVSAGPVTFAIVNKGTTIHSLVILRSDIAHDKMPLDPKDPSKVQETGSIAVTGQLVVGASMRMSRQLTAGQYVLVCNEPAHYAVGMHTALVVR